MRLVNIVVLVAVGMVSASSCTEAGEHPDPLAGESGWHGVMWDDETAADRPAISDGPMTLAVSSLIVTPGPDRSELCARAVRSANEEPGGERATRVGSCLVVEWRAELDETAVCCWSGISDVEVTSEDGQRHEKLAWAGFDAWEGRRESDGAFFAVFPNAGEGATVAISYRTHVVGDFVLGDWENRRRARWDVVVPDSLPPIEPTAAWWQESGLGF